MQDGTGQPYLDIQIQERDTSKYLDDPLVRSFDICVASPGSAPSCCCIRLPEVAKDDKAVLRSDATLLRMVLSEVCLIECIPSHRGQHALARSASPSLVLDRLSYDNDQWPGLGRSLSVTFAMTFETLLRAKCHFFGTILVSDATNFGRISRIKKTIQGTRESRLPAGT